MKEVYAQLKNYTDYKMICQSLWYRKHKLNVAWCCCIKNCQKILKILQPIRWLPGFVFIKLNMLNKVSMIKLSYYILWNFFFCSKNLWVATLNIYILLLIYTAGRNYQLSWKTIYTKDTFYLKCRLEACTFLDFPCKNIETLPMYYLFPTSSIPCPEKSRAPVNFGKIILVIHFDHFCTIPN